MSNVTNYIWHVVISKVIILLLKRVKIKIKIYKQNHLSPYVFIEFLSPKTYTT